MVGTRAQRSGPGEPIPITGRAQPTIGWTPVSLVSTENSSAPNRLARSVSPTAGIPASAARLADGVDLDRAFEQRIGRLHPKMDEPLSRHRSRPPPGPRDSHRELRRLTYHPDKPRHRRKRQGLSRQTNHDPHLPYVRRDNVRVLFRRQGDFCGGAVVYSRRNPGGRPWTSTLVAEGLRFPEGPIAMADGSVILTEIERGDAHARDAGRRQDHGGRNRRRGRTARRSGRMARSGSPTTAAPSSGSSKTASPFPAPPRPSTAADTSSAWTSPRARSRRSTRPATDAASPDPTTSCSTARAASGSPTTAPACPRAASLARSATPRPTAPTSCAPGTT